MPISIPFVATGDKYPVDSGTILAHQLGKSISFTIANNPVAYQLAYLDKSGELKWGDEVPSNPTDGGFSGVAGIRFRSWNAGKPAVIVATLYLEEDATPLGTSAYTASLTASGGQTPGLSSVQVDHNGIATSTEPILNFVDGLGINWAITDVPASQLVQIIANQVPFADVLLAAPAASIDIQNIPGTAKHLLVVYDVKTDAASAQNLIGRFNNDTTANYIFQYLLGNGAATGANSASAQNAMTWTQQVSSAAQGATVSTSGFAIIPNYAGTTFSKTMIGGSFFPSAPWLQFVGNFWNQTVAINRITILTSSGNLIAGSRMTVYPLA